MRANSAKARSRLRDASQWARAPVGNQRCPRLTREPASASYRPGRLAHTRSRVPARSLLQEMGFALCVRQITSKQIGRG